MKKCVNCGTMNDDRNSFCEKCGADLRRLHETASNGASAGSVPNGMPPGIDSNTMPAGSNPNGVPGENEKKPVKRITAALLAIFLGSFGVHKFYLHRVIQGIVYILFSCTFIPSILGVIEGIIYFAMGEEKFNAKYNNPDYVRPKWQTIAIVAAPAGLVIMLFALGSISEYQSRKVDKLIDAGKYEEAKSLLDKEANDNRVSHTRYAKIYAAQGLYDLAVKELLAYCKYADILDVDSVTLELLNAYAENASDDLKEEVKAFNDKYFEAQEEHSKLASAKKEAEDAKAEAEKTKSEAEAAKAEAEKSKAASNGNGGKSAASGNGGNSSAGGNSGYSGAEPKKEEPRIEYEGTTVEILMSDLEFNSMAAADEYKGNYYAVTGKLSVIDAQGKYIVLTNPYDEWAYQGVNCYIKTDDVRNKVKTLSTDSIITVRGKITSVGEILGYSLDIDSID
ncbi:MAG: NINE protein [Lachnospiraceae bacterium]|nr:NINE protein [Lachnospiraceae bacterium]